MADCANSEVGLATARSPNSSSSVLLLAKGYPPAIGGLETYSEQVANAYARRGLRVIVVTAHPGGRGTENRAGVNVINVGEASQPVVFARMLREIRRLFRRGTFDLIHATSWRVAIPSLLLRTAIPIVISVHGREVFVVPRPLVPVMHWAFRRATAVIAVSTPILEALQARLPFRLRRAHVGWNGLSFPERAARHHPHPDFRRLLCLCRLVERKNIPNAIRAVAKLIGEGYDITYEIAGSGEEADRIDTVIQELEAGSRIRRLGRVSDEQLLSLYRECGVFLHPQVATNSGDDLEGFGISIADAMSFGAVAVAGASGGPLDFIQDGQTGILVDGTDVDAIATALRCLLDDPTRTRSIAAAGRRFALERLTWDRHIESAIALGLAEMKAESGVAGGEPVSKIE
jgi:glycosyltransferase involved in cell wall biosynthesis